MKILVKGKQFTSTFKGRCSTCECVFTCEKHELEGDLQPLEGVAKCPNCGRSLIVTAVVRDDN